MPSNLGRTLLAAVALAFGACASRPLPKYEKPLAHTPVQHVRTTAYTHTESDHLAYGASSACGTPLQYGAVHSAAADWSRWPSGTVFRIAETGEVCQVDDYGWALAGTNTIDLYKPDRSSMNAWGSHRVTIEILHWGDPWQSYSVMRPRGKYAHVRLMLKEIADRYPRGSHPAAEPVMEAPSAPAAPSAPEPLVERAQIVSAAPTPAPAAAGAAPRAAGLTPFYR